MKNLFGFLFTAVFITMATLVNAQISTNFQAQLYADNTTHLHLPNVTVEYFLGNTDMITFDIEVKTNTRKNHVFDTLVEQGRYNLEVETTEKEIYIEMPNLRKEITIGQLAFKDKVILKVYIPRGMKVAKQKPRTQNFLAMQIITPKSY